MEALLSQRAARKLSLTGSTEVGRHLAAAAGLRLLRTSLELGGDNPFFVFEDADLTAAVEGALLAKMRNIGEACTAANRILVHEKVASAFSAALAARMSSLTLGHGLLGAEVGPLIEARSQARVSELVQDAVDKGARALVGGAAPGGPGHFFAPTVLTDLAPDSLLLGSEIFGPVAAIQTFEGEDQAIAMANDTAAGLVAYAYTADLNRALRLIDQLEVGMVGLNRGVVSSAAAPFGGIKASGHGREGGREGIEDCLDTKYASIAR